MDRWKILHTEASDGWGGQEIRIVLEMEGLLKRGHRLFLAATPPSQILKEAKARGISAKAVPMNRLQWPASCLALARLIRSEEIDIINTHSSADSWIASGAAYLSGRRPLLIRSRHISTPISDRMSSRLVYDRLPDGIITTSEAIKADMIRKNRFDGEKITSIPTGIDLSRFDPLRHGSGLREAWAVPPSAAVVGTIGVLRSWKGHAYFIQAARLVLQKRPETLFFIVGEGPGRPYLEKEIKEHQLEEKVRLVGHCREVERAFAALDLFVLASTGNEGVPQAVLQAFAMKKPVIATSVTGIIEVVKTGETGRLVPPKDSAALAEAILLHLDRPADGRAMAEAGRRLIEKEYYLDGMLDRVEQFYRQRLRKRKDA
jgi:glycosyltransferase involved in cell wall biosynthesis